MLLFRRPGDDTAKETPPEPVNEPGTVEEKPQEQPETPTIPPTPPQPPSEEPVTPGGNGGTVAKPFEETKPAPPEITDTPLPEMEKVYQFTMKLQGKRRDYGYMLRLLINHLKNTGAAGSDQEALLLIVDKSIDQIIPSSITRIQL